MKTCVSASRLFLVEDMEMEAAIPHTEGQLLGLYRMQLWRGKDERPVILFSQLPGRPSPKHNACRLFNKAWQGYLSFTREPLWYFHLYWTDPKEELSSAFDPSTDPILESVQFTMIGLNAERPYACSSLGTRRPLDNLRRLIEHSGGVQDCD